MAQDHKLHCWNHSGRHTTMPSQENLETTSNNIAVDCSQETYTLLV